MIKTKKGQILDFISQEPRRYKEIIGKFGGSGAVNNALYELIYDEMIYKPAKGLYEIRHNKIKTK